MGRIIVCSRLKNSKKDDQDNDTFNAIGTVNDTTQPVFVCPLALKLAHFTEDFDTFLSLLIEGGFIQNNRGHLEFVETDHACPYMQPPEPQPTTQPLEEQQ